jgi:hypothetical protein
VDLKDDLDSWREEAERFRQSWKRAIRITWALLIWNFVSLATLLAVGFGWL